MHGLIGHQTSQSDFEPHYLRRRLVYPTHQVGLIRAMSNNATNITYLYLLEQADKLSSELLAMM